MTQRACSLLFNIGFTSLISRWRAFTLFLLATTLATFGQNKLSEPSIHGSLSATIAQSNQVNYYGDTDGNTDLVLLEGILNVTTTTNSGWLLSAQTYAYETNDFSEITLDFASASYEVSREFGFSLGRNKLAFGLHNDAQDIDVARTFAILPIGYYPTYLRPVMASVDGVAFSGSFKLGSLGYIDYRSNVGYQQTIHDGAPVIEVFSDPEIDWNRWSFDGLGYSGQIGWRSPDSSMRILASVFEAPDSRTIGTLRPEPFQGAEVFGEPIDVDFAALSFEYLLNDWTFNAEYMRRDLDAVVTIPALAPFDLDVNTDQLYVHSSYVSATYQLTETVSIGAYYNYYDDDRKNISDRPRERETSREKCFSVKWEYKPWALLKLEYHHTKGSATANSSPRGDTTLTIEDSSWDLAVLKSTFFF